MAAYRPGAGRLTNDIAMALLIVAVIALMVLPLPLWLIDSLLAVNLSVSVLLLMTTLFIPHALSLSTFPSLLLFTTLFRLSLNISSTKMILLHADAGHVIEAFGNLVAGGNLVVGVVVFLVITVVQFLVISKGSERVAEVGARFTLDAMPGKQMSIDADLRAGVITGEEAQKKRATLAMESQFHGGMDGAMKFVKGDTIAGLVITLINIVAGIVVGVMYHNMTAGEAAGRFAVLSIGDAMVSQIPSLFICVASGVLITRVADERDKKPKSLGQEMMGQIGNNARSMQLAAGLVVCFGCVPGFPMVPFMALAASFAVGAHFLDKKRKKEEALVISKPIKALQREGARGEPPSIRLSPPTFAKPLAIRMSHELAQLLEADRLDEAMETERQRLQAQLGVPFPGVSMWVAKEMAGSTFDVLLNDVPVREVQVPGRMYFLADVESKLAAVAQKHGPVLGQAESLWLPETTVIPEEDKRNVLDLDQVLARQVMDLLKQHAHLFMGVQEVQWVIDKAQVDYPGLVAEVQKILPLQRIAEVLRRLLEEQVPIRNVRTIFESLIAWGPKEKDMLMLTEYVRGDLGRYLAFEASGGQTFVSAILIDPNIEQAVRSCIKPTPAGNFLAMPPEQTMAITYKVTQIVESMASRKGVAMVTSMDIRRYVRKMIEPRMDWLHVYSYQELGNLVELRPVGRVAP
jgi:type III secretion protein V